MSGQGIRAIGSSGRRLKKANDRHVAQSFISGSAPGWTDSSAYPCRRALLKSSDVDLDKLTVSEDSTPRMPVPVTSIRQSATDELGEAKRMCPHGASRSPEGKLAANISKSYGMRGAGAMENSIHQPNSRRASVSARTAYVQERLIHLPRGTVE